MAHIAEAIDQEVFQGEDSQRDLFLTFHLHGEDYGMAISYVTEIIGLQKITEIPDMPAEIKGVINLRGRVIPVMDVRLRFGMPHRDYDERTCVIVVEVDENITGLVVDRVKEVVEIPTTQIEPPPRHGGAGNYIQGMGKIDSEVKILLDIEALVGGLQKSPLLKQRAPRMWSAFDSIFQPCSEKRDPESRVAFFAARSLLDEIVWAECLEGTRSGRIDG